MDRQRRGQRIDSGDRGELMRSTRYSEAVFDDRWRVAGLRMQPFTVGHAVLLDRVKSPFAIASMQCKDNSAGPADIALAIVICRRPWRKVSRLIQSRILRLRLFWLVARVWHPWAEVTARRQLLAYLSRAWEGPRVMVEGELAESPIDVLGTLLATLVSRMGITPDKAMDLRVAQALWHVCAYFAVEGRLRWMSADEQAMFRQAEEMGHG